MKKNVLFLLSAYILVSCSTYHFSPYGYKVDNDPYYHNAESRISFPLSNDSTSLNFQEVNKGIKQAMKVFKIKAKQVNLLFANSIDDAQSVTVTAWEAKEDDLDFDGYLPQSIAAHRYLYKKTVRNGAQWTHVVYPDDRKKQIGLIFKSTSDNGDDEIERFLAKTLPNQISFFPDKTAIDCTTDSTVSVAVEFPKELIRDEYTLLKFYRILGERKSLEVYTLRLPGQPPFSAFTLCPGVYHISYTDLQQQEIWSKMIDTKDTLEE